MKIYKDDAGNLWTIRNDFGDEVLAFPCDDKGMSTGEAQRMPKDNLSPVEG
jgi:hypothetical protein